jgi:hypothetical protein
MELEGPSEAKLYGVIPEDRNITNYEAFRLPVNLMPVSPDALSAGCP